MTIDNIAAFERLLETNKDELVAERLTMTELAFSQKHKISTARVISCMGKTPEKNLRNPRRVILDKEVVNAMRREGITDLKIAKHFTTSGNEIITQCGTRKANGIKKCPSFPWSIVKNSAAVVPVEKRILNTCSWEQPKIGDEYWRRQGNIIQPGEGPIPILNDLKKGW